MSEPVSKKEKNHICECGKAFEYEYLLERHYKRKVKCTVKKHPKVFICDKCNSKLSNEFSLKRHKTTCQQNNQSKQPSESNQPNESSQTNLTQISNNPIIDIIPQNKNTNKNQDEEHYIYLLHIREFIRTHENVYKIGKTTQPKGKRLSQYPKGSIVLCIIICKNCHKLEKEIIKLFKGKYVFRKDYGSEYFQGDYVSMVTDIVNFIKNEK